MWLIKLTKISLKPWVKLVFNGIDEKNSGLIPFSITLKVSNSNMKISELFGWDVIGSLMGIWWVFPCSNLEATADWSWSRKIGASPDTKRAPRMLEFFVSKRPIIYETQNHSNTYLPPAQLFSTFLNFIHCKNYQIFFMISTKTIQDHISWIFISIYFSTFSVNQ